MGHLVEYALYAAAFIAIVLGIEGAWRLARTFLGEERTITRRLAKAQPVARAAAEGRKLAAAEPGILSRRVDSVFPWLGATLQRARAPVSPVQVLIAATLVFLLVMLLFSLVGLPTILGLVVALALSVGGTWLILTGMVARRRKRFLDQLPQAVDLIARSLQAGHPVATAMAVVAERMPAPLGPEFQVVIHEMTYGLDRDAALSNLVQRFPLAELRMFMASLEVTRESGGNLAEVFLKLAEQIRGKAMFRKKVEAISAEGRLTFWVVSGLPFVVGVLLMLLRPAFYLDVAKDPLFWPMMSMSPVSLAIGSTMIWRMVNVKL